MLLQCWNHFYTYKITFLEKEHLKPEIKLKKIAKFVILQDKTNNPSDDQSTKNTYMLGRTLPFDFMYRPSSTTDTQYK